MEQATIIVSCLELIVGATDDGLCAKLPNSPRAENTPQGARCEYISLDAMNAFNPDHLRPGRLGNLCGEGCVAVSDRQPRAGGPQKLCQAPPDISNTLNSNMDTLQIRALEADASSNFQTVEDAEGRRSRGITGFRSRACDVGRTLCHRTHIRQRGARIEGCDIV